MPKQDERIYREFEGRIGRAVSQLFRHVEGEGIDATPLEGAVTLRIEGGRLAAIEYPTLKQGDKPVKTLISAPPAPVVDGDDEGDLYDPAKEPAPQKFD